MDHLHEPIIPYEHSSSSNVRNYGTRCPFKNLSTKEKKIPRSKSRNYTSNTNMAVRISEFILLKKGHYKQVSNSGSIYMYKEVVSLL
jgi:hypothetical protein